MQEGQWVLSPYEYAASQKRGAHSITPGPIQCQDLRGQDILLSRDKVDSALGNKGLKPWSLTCSLVTYEMQPSPFHVVTYFKVRMDVLSAPG